MKKILLTFDVEEFDLPRELGKPLNIEEEFEISKIGLISIAGLLEKHNIKSTFFTTANFAKKYPSIIKELSKNRHEIACHGYCHADSCKEDISKIQTAKKEIEKITGERIRGFRAPRFEIKDISKLSKFGFLYDSSIHPTWIPGRYNNLNKKRKIHKIGEIIEIPTSVSPFFRLPMSWIFFKNFPLFYSKALTKLNTDYVLLFFHPWEFADLKNISIPGYIKRKSGDELLNVLEKYMKFCKKNNYEFETVEEFLSKKVI